MLILLDFDATSILMLNFASGISLMIFSKLSKQIRFTCIIGCSGCFQIKFQLLFVKIVLRLLYCVCGCLFSADDFRINISVHFVGVCFSISLMMIMMMIFCTSSAPSGGHKQTQGSA